MLALTLLTTYPIFLDTADKPFNSRFQQTVGSTLLAFLICIYLQPFIIVAARRFGVRTESMSVKVLLWHALIRALRFLDCWTDAYISVTLLSAVRALRSLSAHVARAHPSAALSRLLDRRLHLCHLALCGACPTLSAAHHSVGHCPGERVLRLLDCCTDAYIFDTHDSRLP